VAVGHVAIAEGEDAQVEIGLVDEAARERGRIGRRGRHLFHPARQHAHTQARVDGVPPVLGQINRGAADHDAPDGGLLSHLGWEHTWRLPGRSRNWRAMPTYGRRSGTNT
jgi:hypothetical protein